MPTYKLLQGDCLEVLKTLPENSVDAIVTDPPYLIGFMGKEWDADDGIAGKPPVWQECLRVLKPGGHLLSFGGTRTYHRMACAIEDAGFEVRDSIHWVYGSGFPKSLDVSKAIDKRGGIGNEAVAFMAVELRRVREARGLTVREADELFCGSSSAWMFYEGRNLKGAVSIQPPNRERIAQIVAKWPEAAVAFQHLHLEGEVVGEVTHARSGGDDFAKMVGSKAAPRTVAVTAPATDAAKQWEGWGTALKPAHEPIVVARKPLVGTVAANVQQHGTGALNIDGCRVGIDKVGGQRLESAAWEHVESLCVLCAAAAAKNAKPETLEIAESIAARGAAQMRSAEGPTRPGHMSRATDTECLSGLSLVEPSGRPGEALSLSIAASGDKQTATFQPIALSTTSTETNSTTDLKTCASCGATTTGMSITGTLSARQNTSADGGSGTRNTKQNTPSKSDSDGNASGPVGRFPPNLLLSHTPECGEACAEDCAVAEMDRQSGILRARGNIAPTKRHRSQGVTGWGVRADGPIDLGDSGGASRFFPVFKYQAKASRKEREAGLDQLPTVATGVSGGAQSHGEGYDQGQGIGLNRVVKVKNHHPTVKPVALMEWLVTLVTPPNGTVLDPFTGSGTTGIAALNKGFHFIGIEREPSYVQIAKARIESVHPTPPPPAPPAPASVEEPAPSEQLDLLSFIQDKSKQR